MSKNFNIAIAGLGNIGEYFFLKLQSQKKDILKKTNSKYKIRSVCVKNLKKKRLIKKSGLKIHNKISKIYNDHDIHIVVELIGGAEGAAKKLVFESLKNGKHVITANKALMAKYGDELTKIAEKNKVNLEFEASVCAGVPIIRAIKEGLVANKISKIYGIFNGTSNYILTSMTHNQISFDEALNKAKSLGYAESNPKSDLNGEDVAAKLKILSSISFNSKINHSIYIEGIKNIDNTDIINADNLGYKIKLLAFGEIVGNKICQRVHPTMIGKNSLVSNIDGVLNAVIINGEPVGQSIFQGEGAGPKATTSALISDLCSILRGNIKYPFSIPHKDRKKIKSFPISDNIFSFYVRLEVFDNKGVLSDITKIFSDNKISIKRLIQNPYKSKKHSSIVIITHNTRNIFLFKTVRKLSNKHYIIKRPKFIRIDNS